MKVGPKLVGLMVVMLAAVAAGAYTLGQRQKPAAAVPTAARSDATRVAATPPGNLPPNHPTTAGATPPANPGYTLFSLGNFNVKAMYADGDAIWIGTSGGVLRYDPKKDQEDKPRTFTNKTKGILSNGIFHLSKVDGKILAGTYGGGLSVYDEKQEQWRNINIPHGLADQFVYDVVKAKNGDVWIATWSGVNRVRAGRLDDPTAWETFNVENTQGGLPNPWVYALKEGKNGDLWFATEYGLARYQNGKWSNWRHDDKQASLGANYEVVKDAIQFTSDPAASSQHHAQQKIAQGLQDVKGAWNPNYVISLAVDAEGVVWCGTWGGGLARFDGTTWRNFTTADGLPANHIFMLYTDPQGRLWIGTNKGLARLNSDRKSFSVLTQANGLFADSVFSMAHARDGSIWVGSFGGLSHLESHLLPPF